jgi:hypothetical protein
LVWKWTLTYSFGHPFGGGFNSYVVNTIVVPGDDVNPDGFIVSARAFHSIYFEMLGELGWPGLMMFLLAGVTSLVSLFRLSRKCRKIADLAWVADMSGAVQTGILIFLAGGAFVGIAFQPAFWYFVSIGVSLRAFVWHAERAASPEVRGWVRASPLYSGTLAGEPPVWRARADARRGSCR